MVRGLQKTRTKGDIEFMPGMNGFGVVKRQTDNHLCYIVNTKS
jgi:hypothetical protein